MTEQSEEDGESRLWGAAARRAAEGPVRREAYLRMSKARLLRALRKKMLAGFIGALSRCEAHLGYLWGADGDGRELKEEEKLFLALWRELRADILDNGNSQWRAVESELSQYEVDWKKCQVTLPVVGRGHSEDNKEEKDG